MDGVGLPPAIHDKDIILPKTLEILGRISAIKTVTGSKNNKIQLL